MQVCKSWSHWVISLAVSAALLLAPVLPMAAAATGDAEHAAHESIGVMGAAHADATASHIEHGKAAGTGKTSSCDQHDQCNKKCCAACAQCFTAVFTQSPAFLLAYTILSPTAPHLYDRLTVAPHLRPPAV